MKLRTFAAILAASSTCFISSNALACSATTACINEVFVSFNGTPQTTADEYLELRGPANSTFPEGTYFVTLEGDKNAGPGSVDSVIDLGGLSFGANGFMVLLAQGNTYAVNPLAATYTSNAAGFSGLGQNEAIPRQRWFSDPGVTNYERPSATYLILTAPVRPDINDDIDTVGGTGNPPRGDGIPDGAVYASWTIIDSVGAADNPNGDFSYGFINYRTGGSSGIGITVPITARPNYVGRYGDSFGSTVADWVESAVPTGTSPNFFLGVAVPAALQGKPLNHIGSTNAWLNFAPEVNIDATASILEDATLTYAGNLSITDTDSGGASEVVTVTVTNGTLSLSGVAGLAFTAGDGTADAAMTFSGTIAAINAALANAVFTPSAEFSGDATVTVNVDDQGNTGTPFQALSDEETQTITVAIVDDAPVVAAQGFTVSEAAAIGTSVGTVVASDVDSAVLTYSITTVQTTFAIDAQTGAISTLEALDFETTPSYSLAVSVSDGNSTPSATITIDVTNVNDNLPAVADNQVFTIQENAPNGSAVSPGPVLASDPDGDTLTYSFTTPSLAFAINANTGQILVANTQLIDFETTPQFTLNVAVSDGVSSDSADVTIDVVDVPAGVNAPVVHDQAFSIADNVPNGFVVGSVFAVDEDGEPLTFSLDPASAVFAISPSGQITVLDNSSLPTTPTFALNVVVSDGALSDNATITINVTGANASPVVTPSQSFSIAEDAASGAAVGQVAATDAENDPLTFSFDPASSVFAISAAGAITVTGPLDFETTPSYTLTVRVADGTSSGTGSITINVTDIVEDPVPTVSSITRVGANPATASPVQFSVVFSENVTGVDSGDFTLPVTGTVTGQSISSVNCVNASCVVTVSIADGAGTLGLNLADNDTIVDSASQPLAGAADGSLTGAVFDIEIDGAGDNVPPQVVSVARANPSPSPGPTVAFVVTFSEAVTGVDAGDFALTLTGSLATPAITGVTGGGNVYLVTVSTGTGVGTIRLDVMDDDSILDIAANPLGGVTTGNGAFTTGEVYAIDTINPIVIFRDGFENPPAP